MAGVFSQSIFKSRLQQDLWPLILRGSQTTVGCNRENPLSLFITITQPKAGAYFTDPRTVDGRTSLVSTAGIYSAARTQGCISAAVLI